MCLLKKICFRRFVIAGINTVRAFLFVEKLNRIELRAIYIIHIVTVVKYRNEIR